MSWLNKLGYLAAPFILAGAAHTANAQDRQPDYHSREATLHFRNPRHDLDAMADTYLTSTQLAGAGLDRLGGDGHPLPRTAKALTAAWWNHGMQYVFHEMGHELQRLQLGEKLPFNFDLTSWKGHFFPLYIQEHDQSLRLPDNQLTYENQSGFYQDQLNASRIRKHTVTRGNITYDEAFAYLFPKTWQSMSSIYTVTGVWNGGDITAYTNHTRLQGFDISEKDFLRNALITDLLSWPVIESVITIGGYLLRGKPEQELFTIDAGNVAIVPPNIRLFSTTKGFYVDAELPLQFPNGDTFFSNIGTGLDTLGGEGDLNVVRIGGQYHSIETGPLRISPLASLNLGDKIGGAIGADIGVHHTDNRKSVGLTIRALWSHNDVLEDLIKDTPNNRRGLELQLRLTGTY